MLNDSEYMGFKPKPVAIKSTTIALKTVTAKDQITGKVYLHIVLATMT